MLHAHQRFVLEEKVVLKKEDAKNYIIYLSIFYSKI